MTNELLTHENLRVRAYARATGATKIDYRYTFWIEDRIKAAADAGEGAFRFEPDGRAHISNHVEFNEFLKKTT